MKKQIISMAVMAVIFAACGGSKAPATVVGSWVMPINGQPGEVQGIKLEENGEASSINMHTLIYKEWEQQGDQLYLTVKSIGNGIEIEGVDTLKIVKFQLWIYSGVCKAEIIQTAIYKSLTTLKY